MAQLKNLIVNGAARIIGKLNATSIAGDGSEITNINAGNISSGTLPVTRGGTGAVDAATARGNLGITPANIGAATASHNQASNTITAMTGYSKASSAAAVSASDSLNTAIGKIEKALDGKQNTGSYAASSHTHDDRYYTESEIDTKLSGKANTSHGNHVPATETANNAKFLRNDNTWQTVTPANIGAAASSHTHDDRYYTESEINTKLNGKANSSHTHAAADITSVNASAITGVIASANLPSYVDDVLEYSAKANFPATGEAGKIYVDTATNLTYRWGGSAYVEISPSLALGETSSTAYRGDRGATAYTHATSDTGKALSSGLYKITTSARGHVTAGTAVTKADITGLGIPAQDTVYTHPTSSGNKHIPSGGSAGQFLKWSADGAAVWAADNNTWNALKGATATAAGSAGYVAAPAKGQQGYFLRGDATWAALTKSTVGLGNVDNTADANKSVKYATSAGSATNATYVKDSLSGGNLTITYAKDGQSSTSWLASWKGTELGCISPSKVTVGRAATATNAYSATKATQDSDGQQINTTYIKGLSVSGKTITYTKGDGTTGTITTQDNNTTYSAGTGISLSGTTFSNAGVRSISTGGTNGTISVNTNGTTANVAVKGLGSAAYTNSDAYATSGHTHNYAGSSSAGGSATSAVKLDTASAGSSTQPVYFSGGKPTACTSYANATVGTSKKSNSSVGFTTAGTGAAYTATVDGIDTLTVGTSITIVPHTVSTTVSPTLNVNGLGSKMIRRRVSNATGTLTSGYTESWLTASIPVQVTYDGTFWVADVPKPNALDIFGSVEIAHGGTGATTAKDALNNLGITWSTTAAPDTGTPNSIYIQIV